MTSDACRQHHRKRTLEGGEEDTPTLHLGTRMAMRVPAVPMAKSS